MEYTLESYVGPYIEIIFDSDSDDWIMGGYFDDLDDSDDSDDSDDLDDLDDSNSSLGL